VVLANDTAVFDGTGGIRCAMPSIQSLVRDMTDGRYAPAASCSCNGTPIISADVQLNPNTTGADWENPLVYRLARAGNDMALAASVPAFSTLPSASIIFTVNDETAQSNAFIANGMPNTLLATYLDAGDWHQAAFEANGANPGTGVGPVGNLSVTNEATTLYIGYSPATSASLNGTLIGINVDPGCYGTG
jgi:hypothetical protein